MKKKTLATVISMITILFIFTSMSYAATSAEWEKAHNIRRYWHGTPDVHWDNTLAQKAQSWADTCIWNHSQRGSQYRDKDVGENMKKYYANALAPSAESVVSDWYREKADYITYVGYGNEPKTKIVNGWTVLDDPNFGKYGHFTQVVWKKSTLIGCGYNSSCGHCVCQYKTGGNVAGQFKQNVGYNYLRLFKLIYPSLVTQVYPIKW